MRIRELKIQNSRFKIGVSLRSTRQVGPAEIAEKRRKASAESCAVCAKKYSRRLLLPHKLVVFPGTVEQQLPFGTVETAVSVPQVVFPVAFVALA